MVLMGNYELVSQDMLFNFCIGIILELELAVN